MTSTKLDQYIDPPPRLYSSAEALPHLGGLLLAPYYGEQPDEIELYPVQPLRDAFDDAASNEILKNTMALPKVRERLARCRHIFIGVSRRDELDKGEAKSFLVVAYDYNLNLAVEISLSSNGELTGISDANYQPPLVQSEIERSIELARMDDRIANQVGNMVGMVIPFEGVDGEWSNRRVVEVLFGCRSKRLPHLRAWVDLSTETVLQVGDSCECCLSNEGSPS